MPPWSPRGRWCRGRSPPPRTLVAEGIDDVCSTPRGSPRSIVMRSSLRHGDGRHRHRRGGGRHPAASAPRSPESWAGSAPTPGCQVVRLGIDGEFAPTGRHRRSCSSYFGLTVSGIAAAVREVLGRGMNEHSAGRRASTRARSSTKAVLVEARGTVLRRAAVPVDVELSAARLGRAGCGATRGVRVHAPLPTSSRVSTRPVTASWSPSASAPSVNRRSCGSAATARRSGPCSAGRTAAPRMSLRL